MPVISLTQADSGRALDAHSGDRILVELAETAVSGYRWALDRIHGDALVLEGKETLGARAGIGGSATQRFTLQATRIGTSQLELKLWRDWEGDASVIERFRLSVRVQP